MEAFLRAPARQLSRVRSIAIRRNHGVFQYYRGHANSPRAFSNSASLRDTKAKPYYVTTPIFYVNAAPHVGHLYSMLLADTFKRWAELGGREAFLCTGTDEHGMKVQRAAELQEVHPKTLCDANSETFRDLAQRFNIANDHFVRTTDPEHMFAVENFWRALQRSDAIYETKHEGWYCVSDETFYPDNLVAKKVDPTTGKTFMASVETGSAVEWVEEKNYHFRLTAFRDRLLQFYKENPEWVKPATRMTEVVSWVENNLEDLSISRPADRLGWGIPVPDDDSQTIYVWVDALANYLTKAGYPTWQPGAEHLGGWPADVQIIGKDIVRFHCVYWPALLMAAGLPLPKRIITHGHLLINKAKMSKSTGVVVNPFFAVDRFGVDTLRYFLLEGGGLGRDSDYDNELVAAKYKSDLRDSLGNLVSRITRSSRWWIRDCVSAMREEPPEQMLDHVQKQIESISRLKEVTTIQMENNEDPHKAVREIMRFIYNTDKFFHNAAPWYAARDGDEATVNQIIFAAAESVRIAGILLQPFIPDKAGEILDVLGVEPLRRTLADAVVWADNSYGPVVRYSRGGALRSIFPPLPVED